MDEMWSFVHDKSQQYWLWWAIDHHNGVPLAYCFGTREHKNLDELCRLLAPFNIKTVYADNNYAYKSHIHESDVVTGKRNTQRIERKHLSLRTWCSRLVRKSIRFSKCHRMHRIVVSLVINCRFWGRPLPVHLLQDNTEDFPRINQCLLKKLHMLCIYANAGSKLPVIRQISCNISAF